MSNRIRSSFIAASLLAGLCLPVCSQEAPPPAAPAATPSSTTAPSVTPLTLEECVHRALEHGFDIEIQRYNPAYAKDASFRKSFGLEIPGRFWSLLELFVEGAAIEDLAGVRIRNSWSWIQKSA